MRTAEGTYIRDYSLPHNKNHIIRSSKGNTLVRQPDVVREKALMSFGLFQTLNSVISLYIRSMTPDSESSGTCTWWRLVQDHFNPSPLIQQVLIHVWYLWSTKIKKKNDCSLLMVITFYSRVHSLSNLNFNLKPSIIYVKHTKCNRTKTFALP